MTENLSPETLADGVHVASADGGGTVESPAITLAELSKVYGTDFKDTATALKAIKDTKSFVGKRKEDIVAEVSREIPSTNTDDLKSKVDSLTERVFLSENPQFNNKESLDLLKMINPNNLAEAANNPAFKSLYEKAKLADEVDNTKSVIHSNARLSETKTVIDEAIATANARGSTQEDVALVFARQMNKDFGNSK